MRLMFLPELPQETLVPRVASERLEPGVAHPARADGGEDLVRAQAGTGRQRQGGVRIQWAFEALGVP
jgi:hypothetical protein